MPGRKNKRACLYGIGGTIIDFIERLVARIALAREMGPYRTRELPYLIELIGAEE
jgi:hypothetical protein